VLASQERPPTVPSDDARSGGRTRSVPPSPLVLQPGHVDETRDEHVARRDGFREGDDGAVPFVVIVVAEPCPQPPDLAQEFGDVPTLDLGVPVSSCSSR
jgi:hypothetical protein